MRRSGGCAVAVALAALAGLWAPEAGAEELAALARPAALPRAIPDRAIPDRPVADPLVLHLTVVTPRAVGSAFPLERGILATAAHLLAGLGPGDAVTLRRGGAGGATAEARVLAISRTLDLALLRAPAGLPLAPPPADAAPVAYRPLLAAGAVPVPDPVLLAQPRRVSGLSSGETLRVPGVGDGLIVRLAGVAPGFSGGPVLDEAGRLVGMIVAIRRAPASGSAFAPRRVAVSAAVEEALVLPAAALRDETRRLLAQGR